jgi:hypothetical protein
VLVERPCAFFLTGAPLFALACQSVPVVEAPLTLSCPEALDAYCAGDSLCIRQIDTSSESNEALSYCRQEGVDLVFDIFQCPPGMIDISARQPMNSGTHADYLFSAKTGDLRAVIEWGAKAGSANAGAPACLAGPPTLTIAAGPPCVGTSVGSVCSAIDASAE